MGVFDHLQKGGTFSLQGKKPEIRKVVTQKKQAPVNRTDSSASRSVSAPVSARTPRPAQPKRTSSTASHTPEPRASSEKRLRIPSRSQKRPSPTHPLSSDDDDSDTDTSFEIRKRIKVSASAEPDLNRRIRSLDAYTSDGVPESLPLVHAADITSKGKYSPAFADDAEVSEVELQYPSAMPPERYQLVVPRDRDDFKPLDDIIQVFEVVALHYIPEEELDEFENESRGLKRRIRRAVAHQSASEFREVITDYNNVVRRLVRNGSIAKQLDEKHALPLPLVERILTQIYARTVSPRVGSLRQYENGTDNVYGELLPRFISTIFKETKLKSDQVFVDLGSGVGNVVLQAALEIGCESWGCEVMPNACKLADLQHEEFTSRCRLWGIAPGKTHLVHGDFLKEESIIQVLRRADVVLINNQAFTPQLNDKLINFFLDMKEGCQIVSLKSFVPAGHKIQSRNLNSPINLLTVRQLNYWSDSVSWTDVGGTYFIATKDSSRLKAFAETLQ
ncbi:hypothetical protein VTN49DRAFT_5854 [Thermomyces lanuginosus]|uniref:uncharacterized protein n=1 Tax=Thermomyces lanuginosus TaxID=5541 RepID=UPI003743FCB1